MVKGPHCVCWDAMIHQNSRLHFLHRQSYPHSPQEDLRIRFIILSLWQVNWVYAGWINTSSSQSQDKIVYQHVLFKSGGKIWTFHLRMIRTELIIVIMSCCELSASLPKERLGGVLPCLSDERLWRVRLVIPQYQSTGSTHCLLSYIPLRVQRRNWMKHFQLKVGSRDPVIWIHLSDWDQNA